MAPCRSFAPSGHGYNLAWKLTNQHLLISKSNHTNYTFRGQCGVSNYAYNVCVSIQNRKIQQLQFLLIAFASQVYFDRKSLDAGGVEGSTTERLVTTSTLVFTERLDPWTCQSNVNPSTGYSAARSIPITNYNVKEGGSKQKQTACCLASTLKRYNQIYIQNRNITYQSSIYRSPRKNRIFIAPYLPFTYFLHSTFQLVALEENDEDALVHWIALRTR